MSGSRIQLGAACGDQECHVNEMKSVTLITQPQGLAMYDSNESNYKTRFLFSLLSMFKA